MFLPANLRVGASLGYPIDVKKYDIIFSADLNKLLVPTPQLSSEGDTPAEIQYKIDSYNEISFISGIFKSFGDAPGGFKEELQEVAWSMGAEYVYNSQFCIRTGYYNENEYKGNLRYVTFGAGFRSKSFQIDAAYLVATSQSNPLD